MNEAPLGASVSSSFLEWARLSLTHGSLRSLNETVSMTAQPRAFWGTVKCNEIKMACDYQNLLGLQWRQPPRLREFTKRCYLSSHLTCNNLEGRNNHTGKLKSREAKPLVPKANGNGRVKPGTPASRFLAANSQMRWVISRIVISGLAAGQSGAGPEKPSC